MCRDFRFLERAVILRAKPSIWIWETDGLEVGRWSY